MSNIVRVYNHEPTLFMDVTEVDASQSFQSSLTGGATSIGAQSGNRTSTAGTITGRLGNASSTAQYTESPTIRYQPLLGQPLVAQLISPVSVEAIELVLDSYWPVAPVFDFTGSFLTIDKDEFYSALDPLIELDKDSALQYVAGKSDLTKAKESTSTGQIPVNQGNVTLNVTNKPADAGTKDTLDIYLLPYHPHALGSEESSQETQYDLKKQQRRIQLWSRILRVYLGTQAQPEITCSKIWEPTGLSKNPKQAAEQVSLNKSLTALDGEKTKIENIKPEDPSFRPAFRKYLVDVNQLLLRLDQEADVYIASSDDFTATTDCLRDWVELRTASIPYAKAGEGNQINKKPDIYLEAVQANLISHAPLMRTFSALGMLKNATERPHPLVEFVAPETYRTIVGHAWNTKNINTQSFYTLLSDDEDSYGCPEESKKVGCDNPPKKDEKTVSDWIGAREDIAKLNQDVDAYKSRCITITAPLADDAYQQCSKEGKDLEARRKNFVPHNYPSGILVYEKKGEDVLNDVYVKQNWELGLLRRYILIIVDDHPPAEAAYAPYYSERDGKWFYIAGNDVISQKNFHLLSLFMTMMAIPSSTPPLTPTINVGGS